ncbi:MAG: hypothetical protein ACPGWR_03685 [Ardenticatenaceae bacterium]
MVELIPIINLLILWLIILPLATFIHELGHALAALIVTSSDVTIQLGTDKNALRFHCRRLTIILKLGTGFVGCVWVTKTDQLTPSQLIPIYLAGPLASILSSLLFGFVYSTLITERPLLIFAYACFWQFIATIIPIRYPRWWWGYSGYASDGLRLVQTIKKQITN